MRSSYKIPSTERVDFLSSFFRLLSTYLLALPCSHLGLPANGSGVEAGYLSDKGNTTTHTYAKAGTYTVSLSLKNEDNLTATTSKAVT